MVFPSRAARAPLNRRATGAAAGLARRWPALWLMLTLVNAAALVWLSGADVTIGQTVWTGRPINLYDGQTVGQVFSPPRDGLHRLDLMFLSYGESRAGQVTLHLRDEAGTPLASVTIDSQVLRDTWYGIDIPALTGVAGRGLRLELERDSGWRSPIGVRVGPGARYGGDGLIRGERDPSFDLAFRAFMATPPWPAARWERVVEIARALTAARPGPFGQPVFLLLLGGAYAAGLAALTCLVTRAIRRP
jgi:hypothetical protein